MKKINLFILCLIGLLSFNLRLQAQTPFCAGIITEPVHNSQTEQYNYFSVKVTLDHVYDQAVTVSGVINEISDNPGATKIFNLTVSAGNQTAETSLTFFRVNVNSDAEVIVNSISPSSITKSGVTFNTSCTASTEDHLNAVGQLHNDYQDYLLTYITGQNMDLRDTTALKSVISSKTDEFLESKGIDNSDPITAYFGAGTDVLSYNSSNYSTAGAAILEDLKDLMLNYSETNHASFIISLNDLKQNALNLSDPLEVYKVGLPVTVAIYSFTYWKENAVDCAEIFIAQDSIRNMSTPLPMAFHKGLRDHSNSGKLSGPHNFTDGLFDIYEDLSFENNIFQTRWKPNLKKVGVADVSGAVIGATTGGIGAGPAGAIAGGILGSSTRSLYNLGSQILGRLTGWW